jgi:hypothetical protein
LFGQLRDTQRLQDMQTKAAAGGPDVGSQMKSWLPSEEGMQYAPQGTPQYDAFKALGATAKPDSASMPWYAKHTVLAPLAFSIANEAANALGGEQSHGARIAEDLAAFPILMGGMKGYSAIGSAFNRAAQQRALAAAQIAASTRQYQAPFQRQLASPMSDAVRKIIYGQGAAGRF